MILGTLLLQASSNGKKYLSALPSADSGLGRIVDLELYGERGGGEGERGRREGEGGERERERGRGERERGGERKETEGRGERGRKVCICIVINIRLSLTSLKMPSSVLLLP